MHLLRVDNDRLETLKYDAMKMRVSQARGGRLAYLEGVYGDVGRVGEELLLRVLLVITLACNSKRALLSVHSHFTRT